eukprot:TRINITY_DN5017_c0_g1_i2.p1 TRINITY_DN5017_c0_g1~~TRINITY_DN5017_c0_g1_i2.p1  ORF type:complete len:398 (+),score=106.42 TRINITY_DN5017_c0_g1_i2:14-1207(+)
MLKPETIDIEDSNIAGLGGEENREAKKAAAETEKAWEGVGTSMKPGIRVWRIEKFEVKKWPRNQYGKFYNGDSYIILRTYKKKDATGKETDALAWDVHFWLGKETSQDEAGTAAYKTVEIDDLLDDAPVQHREVSGHESDLFLSYWNPPMSVMNGGVDSGFNHVKPTEYKPRLFQMKGKKHVSVNEVPLELGSLNQGDVFVLDNGLMVYQWNGRKSHPNERRKAAEVITDVRSGRAKSKAEVLEDDGSEPEEFWKLLGGKGAIKTKEEGGSDESAGAKPAPPKLFHISDASGSMKVAQKGEAGQLTSDMLDGDDVFLVDAGVEVFVWIGSGATKAEKTKGFTYAVDYLKENGRPDWIPITQLKEGQENVIFWNCFSDKMKKKKRRSSKSSKGSKGKK